MAQVPTPPASRHASASPEVELKPAPTDDSTTLMQSLDDLLERYLHLLDQHQKLQSDMASHLSAGFISLAHANYTCPPGRRYGEDYYDDRMKATRRMQVAAPSDSHDAAPGDEPSTEDSENSHTSDTSKQIFNIAQVTLDGEDEPEKGTDKDTTTETEDAPTPEDQANTESKTEATTPPTSDSETDAASSEKAQSKSKPKAKSRSSDPLRWYGILVPPSLRNAQKSFTEAVEDDLPGLASVVLDMQTVEKEIGRVRRELGQE